MTVVHVSHLQFSLSRQRQVVDGDDGVYIAGVVIALLGAGIQLLLNKFRPEWTADTRYDLAICLFAFGLIHGESTRSSGHLYFYKRDYAAADDLFFLFGFVGMKLFNPSPKMTRSVSFTARSRGSPQNDGARAPKCIDSRDVAGWAFITRTRRLPFAWPQAYRHSDDATQVTPEESDGNFCRIPLLLTLLIPHIPVRVACDGHRA